MTVNTYSFENINGTISGPGGSFRIGAGEGIHDEGITIEMLEDKTDLKIGADGTPMHSLRASNAARVTLRALKTSPLNKFLSDLYNFQKAPSGQNWGQNIIRFQDVARGDVISLTDLAFARQPTITYSKDANLNEWSFLGIMPAQTLGLGIPDVNT
jgi:hypothetical protein